MRLVCLSDTHEMHKQITPPGGDVFIHSGDFSNGSRLAIVSFLQWVEKLPHKHKIITPGNHDSWCEQFHLNGGDLYEMGQEYGVHILVDELIELDGVRFYGSPYTPQFGHWAFMYPRKPGHYRNLPQHDVLITHGPPYGHGDYIPHQRRHAGGLDLLNEVVRVQPSIHVFGHIHEGRGRTKSDETPTRFINAASWDHWNGHTLRGAIPVDY